MLQGRGRGLHLQPLPDPWRLKEELINFAAPCTSPAPGPSRVLEKVTSSVNDVRSTELNEHLLVFPSYRNLSASLRKVARIAKNVQVAKFPLAQLPTEALCLPLLSGLASTSEPWPAQKGSVPCPQIFSTNFLKIKTFSYSITFQGSKSVLWSRQELSPEVRYGRRV